MFENKDHWNAPQGKRTSPQKTFLGDCDKIAFLLKMVNNLRKLFLT